MTPGTLHKFGSSKRTFDPRIPHLSALLSGKRLARQPASVDYVAKMPPNFGMMLNDNLGDCTCAAYDHARRVWKFVAGGSETTEPDAGVQEPCVQACRYNPKTAGPGWGGNEQHVLTFLLKKSARIGTRAQLRHKIAAFVEMDHRITDDVKRAVDEYGSAYIGFPYRWPL